jgi:hypothetical protein
MTVKLIDGVLAFMRKVAMLRKELILLGEDYRKA